MTVLLLQLFFAQGVGSVSAVLWCIQPSQGGGRGSDPRQERQAEFVSMLWPKRAWGRTVVACKASARPERDAEAAIRYFMGLISCCCYYFCC